MCYACLRKSVHAGNYSRYGVQGSRGVYTHSPSPDPRRVNTYSVNRIPFFKVNIKHEMERSNQK